MKHPMQLAQRSSMARRRFYLFAVAVVGAGGIGLFFLLRTTVEPSRRAEIASRTNDSLSRNEVPVPAVRHDPLPEIERRPGQATKVDGAAKQVVRTGSELHDYLAALDKAARARGSVTDDDIRRGVLAIDGLRGMLGNESAALRKTQFVRQMKLLEGQLRVKPTLDRLEGLAAELNATHDPAARNRIVSSYQIAAEKLPPIERLEALGRLRRLQTL